MYVLMQCGDSITAHHPRTSGLSALAGHGAVNTRTDWLVRERHVPLRVSLLLLLGAHLREDYINPNHSLRRVRG